MPLHNRSFANRPELATDRRIRIRDEAGIVHVRQAARALALSLGFPIVDTVLLTACVSEIAREMVHQKQPGQITLHGRRETILIEARFAGSCPSTGEEPEWLQTVTRVVDDFVVLPLPGAGCRLIAARHLGAFRDD